MQMQTRDKLVAVQGRYHSDYRAFEAIEGVFDGAAAAAAAAGKTHYMSTCDVVAGGGGGNGIVYRGLLCAAVLPAFVLCAFEAIEGVVNGAAAAAAGSMHGQASPLPFHHPPTNRSPTTNR
jgi:hypothetical protein